MAVDTELARHVLPELLAAGRPGRHTYEIASAGEARLRDAVDELKAMYSILDTLPGRCDAETGRTTPGGRA